jgi:hypothetical protein
MGTYIGINLTSQTEKHIEEYCLDNNILIKEHEFSKSLHSTIIYSYDRPNLPVEKLIDFLNASQPLKKEKSKISSFELLWNQSTRELSCLGAKLDSNYLVQLNDEIQKEFQIKHLFEEYIPHITFSYNFKGDIDKLPLPDFNIEFSNLYLKELILPKTMNRK